MSSRVRCQGALLVAMAALGAACSSGPSDPVAQATQRTPIDKYFDAGQKVVIEAHSFRPRQLVSIVDRPITFTNRSDRPEAIAFDNENVSSGAIRPGASWAYTPHVSVSITYHAAGRAGMTGTIQVEPLEEGGRG